MVIYLIIFLKVNYKNIFNHKKAREGDDVLTPENIYLNVQLQSFSKSYRKLLCVLIND